MIYPDWLGTVDCEGGTTFLDNRVVVEVSEPSFTVDINSNDYSVGVDMTTMQVDCSCEDYQITLTRCQ